MHVMTYYGDRRTGYGDHRNGHGTITVGTEEGRMMFHKVMFSSSAHGTTGGLVVDTEKVDVQDVAAVSRLYPWSACRQMSRYHVSPAYVTWADAFAHVFDVDILGNDVRPVAPCRLQVGG